MVPGWELIGTNDPLTPLERKRFLVLFQKMCVLDYVIRNTDRNMDNWLIRLVIYYTFRFFDIFLLIYFVLLIFQAFNLILDTFRMKHLILQLLITV